MNRVSVVIPAYNCGPWVAEAVASALAQTHPPAEILVVDDGSTDDTAAHLAAFGSAIRVLRQANGGAAAARNAGVAAAAGSFIAFLDADDVWHPRKLERQLPHLAARPDLGLLATGHYAWPGPHADASADAPALIPVPLDRLIVRNSIVTSTVVARADVLRAAGPFDAELHGPEDFDLWLRVAQRAKLAILPTPLSGYRTVVGSLSKNAVRMEEGMRRILGKLDAAGVFRGRPLFRRRAWAYFRYSCGYMHHAAGHRGRAVRHLALSVAGYPWPFPRADVRYAFGRPRLMLAAALARRTP